MGQNNIETLTLGESKRFPEVIGSYRMYLDKTPISIISKKYGRTRATIYRWINEGKRWSDNGVILPVPSHEIQTSIFRNNEKYEDISGALTEQVKNAMMI